MPHYQFVFLDDDPALERALRDLFRDHWVGVMHADSLQDVRDAVAAHPVTSIISDVWSRTGQWTVSAEQRGEAVALGRTAAVILTSGDTSGATTASDPGSSAIILDRPYQLDRLPILVWAATGHDPNADSAPAS